jgi:hypothetical protein
MPNSTDPPLQQTSSPASSVLRGIYETSFNSMAKFYDANHKQGVAYNGMMVWAPPCTQSLRSYAACWWSVIQLNSRLNTMPNLQGTWNLNL